VSPIAQNQLSIVFDFVKKKDFAIGKQSAVHDWNARIADHLE
jgi:hypothetical protein